MKKYEYRSSDRMNDKAINEIASQGWRLICVDQGWAYYERELQEDQMMLSEGESQIIPNEFVSSLQHKNSN